MPNYEYRCECGKTFERILPIEKRYDTTCSCGKQAQLLISHTNLRIAEPFSVLAHDGTVLHQTQTIEKTPPPGYGMDRDGEAISNLVEV